MGELIDRDKIYKAIYDLACASAGVIDGICGDYAYGLLEAAHMIEEAPAVEAVPMTHDLNCSDLIHRKDVLWITKETGALETQSRVRKLPAVNAVREIHGHWIEDEGTYPGPGLANNICSACGKMIFTCERGWSKKWQFCPQCGTKMDENAPEQNRNKEESKR